MTEFSNFYLGKKKDNITVNLGNIKGGIKSEMLQKDAFSIFKGVLDTNSDQVIDKEEIDKFIEEIKTYAEDNNFSMREAAKYLKAKSLENVKQEELFNFIQNLSQASENILDSSVIAGENNTKTIFIKYKDNSQETIYPDKSSKIEIIGENSEKITRNIDEVGNLKSEIILYKDNSKKTLTYANNKLSSEVVEKDGTITTINYENEFPKSKSVKTGEAIQNYTYINGQELPVHSKTYEKKVWVEKSYQYNDDAKLVKSEVKTGEKNLKQETYEYHENGQISKRMTYSEYTNSSGTRMEKNNRVLTFDEKGKRLLLSRNCVVTWNDGEGYEDSQVMKFNKDGNIIGYVPKDSSLKRILNDLSLAPGTKLYEKFMELNKKQIKTFNNCKVKGFDVGAQIIIPGEVEDKAFGYYSTNPKYEKERYADEHLGHADTQGIPTATKTIEANTTWWNLAKQNLIDIGIKNPTNAQIAENFDILITLNTVFDRNVPIEKGTEVTVRTKESDNLPDRYKIGSYNIAALRKTYPANKYQIKKVRINPLQDEWGGEQKGIFAYHVYDKSTNKKILAVIPSKDEYSSEFTVQYFKQDGKVSSKILLGSYDGAVSVTLYSSDKTVYNTYNKQGTLEKTVYTDPKTHRKYDIKNPNSPNKEIVITGKDYFEIQRFRNGKLYQKLTPNLCQYYDLNGKYIYSVRETREGGLSINYPAADNMSANLKSGDGDGALQIIKGLDKTNYKAFLSVYQTTYDKDLIEVIKESKLGENYKSQILATIRKLIAEDNKITKTKRISQISNSLYKGTVYDISLSGDILSIKNRKSGKVSTINLKDFLSKCSEFERAVIKKNMIENLPGEVLEDLAVETRSVKVSSEMRTKSFNEDFEAAGLYQSVSDSITLSRKEVYNIHLPILGLQDRESSVPEICIHELGHAIDYNGYVFNTNSSSAEKFKDIFEKELKKYIASGKVQYSYEKDFEPSCTNTKDGHLDYNTAYATANEKEMFAECYTLMMLGDCQSKDHILKYFPETFKVAGKLIAEIRQKSDVERYNPIHTNL